MRFGLGTKCMEIDTVEEPQNMMEYVWMKMMQSKTCRTNGEEGCAASTIVGVKKNMVNRERSCEFPSEQDMPFFVLRASTGAMQ